MKDAALTKGLKALANKQLQAYGEVRTLTLDSKAKRMTLEVMLEGEKEALSVEVANYGLYEEEGGVVLKCYGITTSRVWLTRVAQDHLEGKAFHIPQKYVKMLKVMV